MITKQYLLPITFIASICSIGLTACGGSSPKTIDIMHKFDGAWKKACEYDADKSSAEQTISTIDGNSLKALYTQYITQDCSGTARVTINIVADIQYKGEHVTGDCKAEKVDTTITEVTVNGQKIPLDQIIGLLSNVDILSSPQYDIICIDENGALRSGDSRKEEHDASAPEKRPIAMDMSGEGGIKQ